MAVLNEFLGADGTDEARANNQKVLVMHRYLQILMATCSW